MLEKNYGEHLGIPDEEYKNKGANFYNSAKEVLEKSEMILKVNFPLNDEIIRHNICNVELQPSIADV